MPALRILSAQDVRQALPMAEVIAGMKEAYATLSSQQATVPLRSQIPIPAHQGTALFMPAYLSGQDDLAVKIVTVFPENARRHEPTIYATVLVLDGITGRPLALLEGSALTAIRTGAGSGAATDVLARPEAETVAIIGSGTQARTQLEAVCTVRTIRQARVYSPNRVHAQAFAREMAGQGSIPGSIAVAASAAEAVRGADIVCTATTASRPVFDGRDLQPGCHVNAVGSFTADMQEVDSETVRRALVVVDSRPAVLAEAGDLLVPLAAGVIGLEHIHAELGEIIAGRKPGRQSAEQITYFKSVGVAVQDVVAGRIALENALALGLGTVVDL
jgi:ornithine cyclodeaminase/alanine dehydrogenase-like protein (mu-crystallin family)